MNLITSLVNSVPWRVPRTNNNIQQLIEIFDHDRMHRRSFNLRSPTNALTRWSTGAEVAQFTPLSSPRSTLRDPVTGTTQVSSSSSDTLCDHTYLTPTSRPQESSKLPAFYSEAVWGATLLHTHEKKPSSTSHEVKLKPRSSLNRNAMSKLFSQRERSSSSNQFKTKTEAMSMRQPSFASASANAVDPNHPRDGEGVPAEVQVPNETGSTKSRNRHGDANGSPGPDPGLAPIGSDRDHHSHRTPSVGDPDVDTRWVLATEPRPRPPPARLALMEHPSYMRCSSPGVQRIPRFRRDLPHQWRIRCHHSSQHVPATHGLHRGQSISGWVC